MELTIKVKQAGRKHALIDNKIIHIEDIGNYPTAEKLITAIVYQQVNEYNSKPTNINLVPFLTDDAVADQMSTGKISFGSIYNDTKADVSKAVSVALQAFKDGMFALFINEDEISDLSNEITINQTTPITFVRLTFLAGSYW